MNTGTGRTRTSRRRVSGGAVSGRRGAQPRSWWRPKWRGWTARRPGSRARSGSSGLRSGWFRFTSAWCGRREKVAPNQPLVDRSTRPGFLVTDFSGSLMPRVLICDKLDEIGLDLLKSAGLEVDDRPGLKGDDLRAALQAADALIVRSATRVTADLLENPGKLRAIARAGVGVDTIDV